MERNSYILKSCIYSVLCLYNPAWYFPPKNKFWIYFFSWKDRRGTRDDKYVRIMHVMWALFDIIQTKQANTLSLSYIIQWFYITLLYLSGVGCVTNMDKNQFRCQVCFQDSFIKSGEWGLKSFLLTLSNVVCIRRVFIISRLPNISK